MTARVKRQAVLVLTWIVVTASATAMAWWSVTFVTAEVADRRPLRPSDVVAASVRQVVPVPAWASGSQPVGPPPEPTVTPMTGVVVEAVAAVATPAAAVPVSAPAVKPTVVAVSRLAAAATVTHAAVPVRAVSLAPITLKPAVPAQPVPAGGTTNVLSLASAAVLAHPLESSRTSSHEPDRRHGAEKAEVTPAKADRDDHAATAGAVAPKRQVRHSTHCDRPAPPA